MATAETVNLGLEHEPKEESLHVFDRLATDIKRELQHIRHEHDKHEPEYFAAVKHLSDKQLTTFTSANLVSVRVASSAYGIHIFGKLFLPETEDSYVHLRLFVAGEEAKFHSFHTEQIDNPDGSKDFKGIFSKSEPLEWFDE